MSRLKCVFEFTLCPQLPDVILNEHTKQTLTPSLCENHAMAYNRGPQVRSADFDETWQIHPYYCLVTVPKYFFLFDRLIPVL